MQFAGREGADYNPPVPDTSCEPINAATRLCAVYGHPVRHSASPAMQNAGIARLGLNWRYLAFDVHPDRLKEAMLGARAMGYVGLNLTVPHKILALDLVDVVDPAARVWGAVNTIRFEGRSGAGEWLPIASFHDSEPEQVRSAGFNTDAGAIVRSVHEDLGMRLNGRKVVLLGTGGAGRAAALKIAEQKPSLLVLINRTRAKAEALAGEILREEPGTNLAFEYPDEAVDLVVNATSLGLRPDDPLPVLEDWLGTQSTACVYDMIYRPAETLFLKIAREIGCRTANGIGMLLHQGADALELWSGRTAPRDIMRRALEQNIYG